MPVKPIIDIELNDEAFRRFYELFEDYSAELDAMPEKWRNLGSAMGESTDSLAGGAIGARDALALSAAQATVITSALKDASKAQNDLGRSTASSAKGMSTLAKSSRDVWTNLERAGAWVARIGAFAGLGTLLSGFGIGELTSAAFSRFKAAGQLGVSPGELASFQVNAQQFLSTQALEAAANAKIDISKAGSLSVLGVDWQHAQRMTDSDLAFEELKAARSAYLDAEKRGASPLQTPAVMSYLALGGSLGDVRNAAMQPLAELIAAQNRTRAQAGALGFDRQTGQAWANLKMTLDRAGMKIQTALIDSLSRVAPEIGHLADDVSKFISGFVDSPKFIHLLDEGAHGLEKMLTFLENVDWPKVGENVSAFGQDVAAVAKFLADHLGWIPGMVKAAQAPVKGTNESQYDFWWGRDDWADKALSAFGGELKKELTNTFKSDKSAVQGAWDWFLNKPQTARAAVLAAITGQESGGDNSATNRDSGASGRYQFMPGTAKSYLPDWWRKKYGDTITGAAASHWKANEGHVQDAVAAGYYDMLERHAFKLSGKHHDARLIAAGWYGGTGGMDLLARNDPRAFMEIDKNGDFVKGKGAYPSLAEYSSSVGGRLSKGVMTAIGGVLATVDSDIKKHGRDWMAHLPKDVAAFVSSAHLSRAQQTSTDVTAVNRAILKALSQRVQKPAHVAITNRTSARVSISANAAALS